MTRCLAVTVSNRLDEPITVTDVAVEIDPDAPPPPMGCRDGELELPRFAGAVAVPPGQDSTLPALRISLRDSASNQDPCKQAILHLRFTGLARLDETGGGGGVNAAEHPSVGVPHGRLSFTGVEAVWTTLLGTSLLVVGAVLLVVSRRRPPPRRSGGVVR